MKAKEYPDQEYLKSILDYSPRTGIFVWKFDQTKLKCRNTRHAGKQAGCQDQRGYIRINISGRYYLAHRLAWIMMNGAIDGDDVDHTDLNPSNNKWSNLRKATRSQNLMNKSISNKNTSGFKGVSLFKRDNLWHAQIQINGKNKHIGYYNTPEDAHSAYCTAAKKYHGDFARMS
jgi:hypothetical protein